MTTLILKERDEDSKVRLEINKVIGKLKWESLDFGRNPVLTAWRRGAECFEQLEGTVRRIEGQLAKGQLIGRRMMRIRRRYW